jgi:hypothetical protein
MKASGNRSSSPHFVHQRRKWANTKKSEKDEAIQRNGEHDVTPNEMRFLFEVIVCRGTRNQREVHGQDFSLSPESTLHQHRCLIKFLGTNSSNKPGKRISFRLFCWLTLCWEEGWFFDLSLPIKLYLPNTLTFPLCLTSFRTKTREEQD